jgi:pimeloyl-ACP methyl ester carboxylesterase
VVGLLAGRFRLLVPDRPGYGRSAGPAVGVEANARVLLDAARARDALPAVLVGHSFGGAVALRAAQICPEAVSALVLVAAAASEDALGRADRVLAGRRLGPVLSFALIRTLGHIAHIADRHIPTPTWARLGRLGGIPRDRLEAHAVAWSKGPVWRSFAVEQAGLVAETPVIEAALGDVGVSVFMLAGRRDVIVSAHATRRLAAAIPKTTLQWVPDGGHMLMWQFPALVAEVVERAAAAV